MRLAILGMVVLAFATGASAQDTTADAPAAPALDNTAGELDQAARLIYEAGTRAYSAGQFAQALMRYQNAYQLSQRPELIYNIAVCQDRLDHKEDATNAYEMFLDALPNSPRAPLARARMEILRAGLARQGSTPNDASTASDESVVADARVTSGDRMEIPPNATRHEASENAQEPEASGRARVGPILAFSAAGAGLVTLAVAGLFARKRYRSARTDCQMGACDSSALDRVDTAAHVADIGLGVAALGAAVGAILLLTGGRSEGREDHARIVPSVGRDGAGMLVQGTF